MIVQNPPARQERRETVQQAAPKRGPITPAIKRVPKRAAPQPVRDQAECSEAARADASRPEPDC